MKKVLIGCIAATTLLLNNDGNVVFGTEIAQASSVSTYKTTANLNMRTGASIKYSRILTIPKGKNVTFISKKHTKSGIWYKVKYNNKKGWLSGKYIKAVKTTKPVQNKKTSVAKNKVTAKNKASVTQKNTNTSKVQLANGIMDSKTLGIAHRGGAGDMYTEESLLAYKQAVDKQADYIELDLRLTKDNQLVLMHDGTVDRTTNGTGNVSDYTLSELKQLNMNDGQKVPSLEELFATFGKTTKYYIETRKVDGKPVMEGALVKLIKKYGLEKQVIVQSYYQDSLKKVHSLDSDIPLVLLLVGDAVKNVNINAVKLYAMGVGPKATLINKSFVDRMHAANLKVHAWFDHENEKEFIKKTLGYGVDGVFTDYLDDTQKMIDEIEIKE